LVGESANVVNATSGSVGYAETVRPNELE